MHDYSQWMFPHAVTSQLSEARGETWRDLTRYIASLEEDHEDSLAFALMMIKFCGCVTCQPGSYKLSLGCATCAYRTVANIKSSDKYLQRRYEAARQEVRTFMRDKTDSA